MHENVALSDIITGFGISLSKANKSMAEGANPLAVKETKLKLQLNGEIEGSEEKDELVFKRMNVFDIKDRIITRRDAEDIALSINFVAVVARDK